MKTKKPKKVAEKPVERVTPASVPQKKHHLKWDPEPVHTTDGTYEVWKWKTASGRFEVARVKGYDGEVYHVSLRNLPKKEVTGKCSQMFLESQPGMGPGQNMRYKTLLQALLSVEEWYKRKHIILDEDLIVNRDEVLDAAVRHGALTVTASKVEALPAVRASHARKQQHAAERLAAAVKGPVKGPQPSRKGQKKDPFGNYEGSQAALINAACVVAAKKTGYATLKAVCEETGLRSPRVRGHMRWLEEHKHGEWSKDHSGFKFKEKK